MYLLASYWCQNVCSTNQIAGMLNTHNQYGMVGISFMTPHSDELFAHALELTCKRLSEKMQV